MKRLPLAFFCFVIRLSAADFACQTEVPAPSYVRPEGLAELLADIRMICDGEVPAAGVKGNIDLYFNTNALAGDVAGPSLLLVGDGSSGWRLGENALPGAPGSANLIRWAGVSLAAPGARGPFKFRFANLRMDASQLGAPMTVVAPTLIYFYIEIKGVEVRSQQRLAAVITPATTARVLGCNGRDAAQPAFFQNASANPGLAGDADAGGAIQFTIRFAEPFEGAFKPLTRSDRAKKSDFADPAAEAPDSLAIPSIRRATYGTRFLARFANIPRGVDLFVTIEPTLPGMGTSDSIKARLVGFTPTGDGDPQEPDDVKTAKCDTAELAVARVPLTSGSGSAVWEVATADPNTVEEISFGVAIAYRSDRVAGLPGLGSATLSAGLAPVATYSRGLSRMPLPRFVDTGVARNLFQIQLPVTRLLFPIVTNQAGYDTVLTIQNSDSTPGRCVLKLSGTLPGGSPGPNSIDLPSAIAAGASKRLSLSEIAPGFQGCILAECYLGSAQAGFEIYSRPDAPPWIRSQAWQPGAVPAGDLDALDKQTYGHARKCTFLQTGAN